MPAPQRRNPAGGAARRSLAVLAVGAGSALVACADDAGSSSGTSGAPDPGPVPAGTDFTAAAAERQFGFNNDFAGLLSIEGAPDTFLLVVNHE